MLNINSSIPKGEGIGLAMYDKTLLHSAEPHTRITTNPQQARIWRLTLSILVLLVLLACLLLSPLLLLLLLLLSLSHDWKTCAYLRRVPIKVAQLLHWTLLLALSDRLFKVRDSCVMSPHAQPHELQMLLSQSQVHYQGM